MRTALLIATLVFGSTTTAAAQAPERERSERMAPAPLPIEDWSIAKVSAIGSKMYDLDRAAWLATDALRAAITRDELASVRGWLIAPEGNALKVSFYRQGNPDPIPGWDIVVGRTTGPVTPAVTTSLSEPELAQTRALALARSSTGTLQCSERPNTVIMKEPDSDDWLVWLLTPMPENGSIPIGGHYRFRISADGTSVLRRDQLSNTCFFADRPPADSREAMLFFTQIVSKGPVETQVFLSIQNQITLVISADGRYFSVGGARITDITDMVNKG